jgi:hypothetical protein
MSRSIASCTAPVSIRYRYFRTLATWQVH